MSSRGGSDDDNVLPDERVSNGAAVAPRRRQASGTEQMGGLGTPTVSDVVASPGAWPLAHSSTGFTAVTRPDGWGDAYDLLELQGSRGAPEEYVCSTGNFGSCVNSSARRSRAFSASQIASHSSIGPEIGGWRRCTTSESTGGPTIKARPSTSTHSPYRAALRPTTVSQSNTLTNLPTARASVIAASSLVSPLLTQSASETCVLCSTDTTDFVQASERATNFTGSALESPKSLRGRRYEPDRQRQRQHARSILEQLGEQEVDVETASVPAMPTQQTLSRPISLLAHQDQMTGHLSDPPSSADANLSMMSERASVDNMNGYSVPFASQRDARPTIPPPTPLFDVINHVSTAIRIPQQAESGREESEEAAGLRPVTELPSFSSPSPSSGDALATRRVFLQQAHAANTEERRVRLLYHTRPRCQVTTRPLVVTNTLLDRPGWSRPLCDPVLCLPCMRNTVYSKLLRTTNPTLWEPDFFGLPPSHIAASVHDTLEGFRDTQLHFPSGRVPVEEGVSRTHIGTLSQTVPLLYDLPLTAQRRAHNAARNANPHSEAFHSLPTTVWPNPFNRPSARSATSTPREVLNADGEMDGSPVYVFNNCLHLLYRCFCVRCSIASQAHVLQADATMRGFKSEPFPCCSCLAVESASYSDILCFLSLLDCVTLGMPMGCCCYHGMGTTLYGWHLRYMLRARYRIFAWTSIDLLIMCCIPGLAVDQQGAELLLNGTPEATIGLHFMI